MSHVQRANGAAQRRRGRMVRSWWGHKQRSVAAVVETWKHHSVGKRAAAPFLSLFVLAHRRLLSDFLEPPVHTVLHCQLQ